MLLRFIFDILYIGFLAIGVLLQLTFVLYFIGYGLYIWVVGMYLKCQTPGETTDKVIE